MRAKDINYIEGGVPTITITDTELSPSEISLKLQGYEELGEARLLLETVEGDLIDEIVYEGVGEHILDGVIDKGECIIKVDDVTSRSSVQQPESDLKELQSWFENL